MPPNPAAVKRHIRDFEFRRLVVNELGWDKYAGTPTVAAGGRDWSLVAVAEKRGVRAFAAPVPTAADLPTAADARAVATALADDAALSVLVFHDAAKTRQVWQFTHRATAAEVHRRRVLFDAGQSGEALAQELARVSFDLSEEASLTHVDAAARLRAAARVERTTKRSFAQSQAEPAASRREGWDCAITHRGACRSTTVA